MLLLQLFQIKHQEVAVIQLSNGLLFPGVQYVTERVNRQAVAGVLTLVSGVSIHLYPTNNIIYLQEKYAEVLLKFRCTETDRQTDRQTGGLVGGRHSCMHMHACMHAHARTHAHTTILIPALGTSIKYIKTT